MGVWRLEGRAHLYILENSTWYVAWMASVHHCARTRISHCSWRIILGLSNLVNAVEFITCPEMAKDICISLESALSAEVNVFLRLILSR